MAVVTYPGQEARSRRLLGSPPPIMRINSVATVSASSSWRWVSVSQRTDLPGGAGRWRDRHYRHRPAESAEIFVDADPGRPSGHGRDHSGELRPHASWVTATPMAARSSLTTCTPHRHYRPRGCSGGKSGTADHPGDPWTVSKFYWTVLGTECSFRARGSGPDDLRPEWVLPRADETVFGYSDDGWPTPSSRPMSRREPPRLRHWLPITCCRRPDWPGRRLLAPAHPDDEHVLAG